MDRTGVIDVTLMSPSRGLCCNIARPEMPKSDERYIAYQLLRELDAITSSIMAQVAYGRFGDPAWLAAQVAHREAFEKWMLHAATLSPPASGLVSSDGAFAGEVLATPLNPLGLDTDQPP